MTYGNSPSKLSSHSLLPFSPAVLHFESIGDKIPFLVVLTSESTWLDKTMLGRQCFSRSEWCFPLVASSRPLFKASRASRPTYTKRRVFTLAFLAATSRIFLCLPLWDTSNHPYLSSLPPVFRTLFDPSSPLLASEPTTTACGHPVPQNSQCGRRMNQGFREGRLIGTLEQECLLMLLQFQEAQDAGCCKSEGQR